MLWQAVTYSIKLSHFHICRHTHCYARPALQTWISDPAGAFNFNSADIVGDDNLSGDVVKAMGGDMVFYLIERCNVPVWAGLRCVVPAVRVVEGQLV